MAFLLGFLVTLVYIPNYTGAAIPTGWAFLWIFAPLLLILDWWRGREIILTAPHWCGLGFLVWCALSLLWAPDLYGAGFGLFELGPFALLFLWASAQDDITDVYCGLACGLAINAILAILQWKYGVEWVGQLSRPAGLFVSKNVLGELSALIAIALATHGLWRYLPATLPGLLLTGSRGAWLAIFAALFVALWRWRRTAALASLALPIVAMAITFAFGLRTASLDERWIWAKDTIQSLTIEGHGFGSYGHEFPNYAQASDTSIRRPDHLHNDLLELTFEIGIGIFPILLFLLLCLEAPLWSERMVLVAFIAISLFEMPLHAPAEACLGAVVAGRLARARLGLRHHVDLGRSAEHGWLSRGRYRQG